MARIGCAALDAMACVADTLSMRDLLSGRDVRMDITVSCPFHRSMTASHLTFHFCYLCYFLVFFVSLFSNFLFLFLFQEFIDEKEDEHIKDKLDVNVTCPSYRSDWPSILSFLLPPLYSSLLLLYYSLSSSLSHLFHFQLFFFDWTHAYLSTKHSSPHYRPFPSAASTQLNVTCTTNSSSTTSPPPLLTSSHPPHLPSHPPHTTLHSFSEPPATSQHHPANHNLFTMRHQTRHYMMTSCHLIMTRPNYNTPSQSRGMMVCSYIREMERRERGGEIGGWMNS